MAAKPLAPIRGTSACSVGAIAVNPAAIAGAAKPVEFTENILSYLEHSIYKYYIRYASFVVMWIDYIGLYLRI
jgi:hypothetical protein